MPFPKILYKSYVLFKNMSDKEEKKVVTFILSGPALEKLEKLQKKRGGTTSELFRDALTVLNTLDELKDPVDGSINIQKGDKIIKWLIDR